MMSCIRTCTLTEVINLELRFTENGRQPAYIWHDVHGKFEHVSGLKSKLVADHEDKFPPVGDLECEYFHKGSKRWIENDQDLEAMYNLFTANDEITVWCEGKLPTVQSARGCKRKAEEQELPTKTKPDKFDELAHELYEKHGES